MPQSSAQRQKRYRQWQTIEKMRNEFAVTLLLEQAEIAEIALWPILRDCAMDVFEHNGDGIRFIRNVLPLAYVFLFNRNLMPSQRCRPGRLPISAETH